MREIKLTASTCRHCKHFDIVDGNRMLDKIVCDLTKLEIKDYDTCSEFNLCDDIFKELKETLGFRDCEISLGAIDE